MTRMTRARRSLTPIAAALVLAVVAGLAGGGAHDAAAQDRGASSRRIKVRITEPIDGDFIFGKARIAAQVEATDQIPDIRVEFSVGGRLIFIDREAPFETFHDFGDQPRSWVIEAVALSSAGDEARHAIVTRKLTIDYFESVDRVVVTASVTDKDRSFVPDLTRENFTLYEDDVEQRILEFLVETRPITMAVLIDTSGSMREEIDQVQEAAKKFVNTLRPEDRAMIIDFDENVYLLQNLTGRRDLLHAAIEGTDAEGGTALYDAVFAAYRKMRGVDGRKTIVLLTDGADTNSRFSYQKVIELTRTRDVTIYSIGLGATVLDVGIRGSLKHLADETGGRAFFPSTAADLREVYDQIAQDLRSQYFLAYSPKRADLDGSWRKIRLESSVKGLRIKTRKGYYAVKN